MNDITQSNENIHDQINNSKGMEHLNRVHLRSFSINIFKMNALELIEVTQRINDPDEGLRLMTQDNREAGNQIHREVTRRIHNFVASAITLVEHTRNFMREYYPNTSIYIEYQNKINSEFLQEPIIKFVQDLRNYMLHNGLPPTQMFLDFKGNMDGNGTGKLTTGIRLKTAELLEWSKWTAPAKQYLESADNFIDINVFVKDYQNKVLKLHEWLGISLDNFHLEDLQNLQNLQINLSPIVETLHSDNIEEISNMDSYETFDLKSEKVFNDEQTNELNILGNTLTQKIQKINIPEISNNGFVSQRLPSVTITEEELLKDPEFWIVDDNGDATLIFAKKSDQNYGLTNDTLINLESFLQNLIKSSLLEHLVSQSFLHTAVITWLRSHLYNSTTQDLSSYLSNAIHDNVQLFEFYAPIANLEIQEPISFGPVDIIPLNQSIFDTFESRINIDDQTQLRNKNHLFQELRLKMQGLSAIYIKEKGDIQKIQEKGQAISSIVIGLFRFLSPDVTSFPSVCAIDLLGSEFLPISNILVYNSQSFVYKTGIVSPNIPIWRITKSSSIQMRPKLDSLVQLIYPEKLSEFALLVRSSVLLFSTGSTLAKSIERLSYCLSAVEGILLKHSAEPVTFNVAERMALLVSAQYPELDIESHVREAYRLRSRKEISPLTNNELSSVNTFVNLSHTVIDIALLNISEFSYISEFITAIHNIPQVNEKT